MCKEWSRAVRTWRKCGNTSRTSWRRAPLRPTVKAMSIWIRCGSSFLLNGVVLCLIFIASLAFFPCSLYWKNDAFSPLSLEMPRNIVTRSFSRFLKIAFFFRLKTSGLCFHFWSRPFLCAKFANLIFVLRDYYGTMINPRKLLGYVRKMKKNIAE